MKIIKPYFEIVEGLENPIQIMKKIEKVGRTAYQSFDHISEDSYKRFIKMIVERNHGAVLEFHDVIIKFVSNRGFTHELVRHRLANMLQESTRYCSYDKDKFGNQITFIWPEWFTNMGLDLPYKNMEITLKDFLKEEKIWKKHLTKNEFIWFKNNLIIEKNYFDLLENGWTPQQARDILPNALKAEIVFKANLREWMHIFSLRAAKAAHPQMRELMIPLQNEFRKQLPLIFGE